MTRDPVLHAQDVIHDFMEEHKSAAIPTLVLTATAWAVEHGGADVMRGTLESALDMIGTLQASIERQMQ